MAPQARSGALRGLSIQREPLLPGPAGVERTRERMIELIRRDAKDPEVRIEACAAAFNAHPFLSLCFCQGQESRVYHTYYKLTFQVLNIRQSLLT